MGWITLEDLEGSIEGVLWAETLADITAKYPDVIALEQIVFIKGRVDRKRETPSLQINDVIPVAEALAKLTTSMVLKLNEKKHKDDVVDALLPVIKESCAIKAAVVDEDEREHGRRRTLNFGHTTGHALEAVTKYRRFRHGEAVGYGMLVAGEMSKSLGMLATNELELLREAVRLCGPLPRADDLSTENIAAAMKLDKKSVSGIIKWVLLERIGRARIVGGNKIDKRVIRSSIQSGLRSQNRER